MNIQKNNVKKLKPYTCARDLFKEGILLDANESPTQWVKVDNSLLTSLNRYPDSTSESLRQKLCDTYVKGFGKDNIFVGAGSDEIIDLLIRAYVEKDQYIMVMNPSYSIYKVQAAINDIKVKSVNLKEDFSLDINAIEKDLDKVKVMFLCSPNNPSGNLISEEEIKQVLKVFKGVLVIDEAYIEYAGLENSLTKLVKNYSNVVILRTFSKAWGLAGLRVGYSISDESVVKTLLKIKDSYNVSKLSQEIPLQALDQIDGLNDAVKTTLVQKRFLENELKNRGIEVIPTCTNFILAKFENAKELAEKICKRGVIVRDRSNQYLLDNVIRISVGTNAENIMLINLLDELL